MIFLGSRSGAGQEQVITTDGHMPRAIKTFEVEGLAPIAAPKNNGFVRAGSPDEKIWQRWLPSADGIGSNHQWLYEKVALVWQQIKIGLRKGN